MVILIKIFIDYHTIINEDRTKPEFSLATLENKVKQKYPGLKHSLPGWMKEFLRSIVIRSRQLVWPWRSPPHILILGAQKAGTTSLYNYMAQHPQIFPGYHKEIHFFDGGLQQEADSYSKGPAWYRAHFPLKRKLGVNGKTLEASPLYLFHPLAPKRIREMVPQVKLIAILRNPTERALSHYFHEERGPMETLPVLEALQAEESRLDPILKNKDYKNNMFGHYSYKKRGVYHEQIERYLKYFPREQILILNCEKFFSEPLDTLKRVFEFVGVDSGYHIKDLKPLNVSSNRSKIDPEIYKYLDDYFRPYNEKLYKLIGESYDW